MTRSYSKPIEITTPHLDRIQRRLADPHYKPFSLDQRFVDGYSTRDPGFGFNGLGEITYLRTYSRFRPQDGKNERWHQTIARVVEGAYTLQKRRIVDLGKEWSEEQAQRSAREMYDRMFNMKFLPPGRGLWAMGSPITEEKGIYAALNNCAFVSTQNLGKDLERPFTFLMDALMLGVGVGFDTRGAGQITIKRPDSTRAPELYRIPDTREGWVKSAGILLRSYFLGDPEVNFDYSHIRKAGEPIRTFGGKSAGPEPLMALHNGIRSVLGRREGMPITLTDIVDIENMIGKAVVAGNVRRSAEIAFGEPGSLEFLDLKNALANPERNNPNSGWGWSSNNSIFAELGMNYKDAAERVRVNGEPGFAWLENMRGYSRMIDPRNDKDYRVLGGNPCLEQSLESYELCCLVENFVSRHANLDDFLRTLKFYYLYAKSVTLGETHWPETNEVMSRNRRIGCSVTGVAQFLENKGMHNLRSWLDKGYSTIQDWDRVYSDWLAIPRSIKTTSVKPSGTVSLLGGATAGIHYPESEYYLKNIRISGNNPMLKDLEAAGYHMEPLQSDNGTMVVSVPVSLGGIRTRHQVSMWEQLENAATLQGIWADNQVSATISFDPKTEGHQIDRALDHFQYKLKGISFLPLVEEGAYPQMPEQAITKKQYEHYMSRLKPLKFSHLNGTNEDVEKFCDGDKCTLPGSKTWKA